MKSREEDAVEKNHRGHKERKSLEPDVIETGPVDKELGEEMQSILHLSNSLNEQRKQYHLIKMLLLIPSQSKTIYLLQGSIYHMWAGQCI